MPFTLAHAAAALPLRRTRLVWSALVVGTMAPDFEYFLRMAPDDGYGHTLAGIFVLTLPLALVVLWLFHAYVKGALVALMPVSLRRCLSDSSERFSFSGAGTFGWIVFSILVGIATHLAWDSFTHQNTWLYRQLPALREPAHAAVVGRIPLYKIFQHGSTAIGFGALAVWGFLHCRKPGLGAQITGEDSWPFQKWAVLGTIVVVAFTGALIRAASAAATSATHLSLNRMVGLWVVTLIALVWWQLVLYGFWREWKLGRPSGT